jgi:hypothetical protein
MSRYTVTLYITSDSKAKPNLCPIQVDAVDRDDAQEKVIAHCEHYGLIHGDIVSIVKHSDGGSHV